MKLATAQQMKTLDRIAIEGGIPSILLMERAGQCLADLTMQLDRTADRISVLCGTGNNGGDGLSAARLLLERGMDVRVFLVGDPERLTPDAQQEAAMLSDLLPLERFDPKDESQQQRIRQSALLIDALFGVGLSRPIAPDSLYADAIRTLNDAPGKVIAADIPSGVDASTGQVMGCAVQADRTVTFTMGKIGHFVGQGGILTGELEVCDIGIPSRLMEEMTCSVQTVDAGFVRTNLPPRPADGHKGTFGKLLVIGGSTGYTGAPYLTASAAVRSGCGLVYLGVPETIWPIEAVKCTSAMPFPLPDSTHPGRLGLEALEVIRKKAVNCDALALGIGLGRHEDSLALVRALLDCTPQPVVLDADGIFALAGHMDVLDRRRERGWVTILTPHDKEYADLTGLSLDEIANADRVRPVEAFARTHGCVLVLKGHHTLTAMPEGVVLVNTTGNAGMAKGGSGDVLTGIIASLLCQGLEDWAAACGVWLHGAAGDQAAEKYSQYAMTPEDILSCLPDAFHSL